MTRTTTTPRSAATSAATPPAAAKARLGRTGPALVVDDRVFPIAEVVVSIGRRDRIRNVAPAIDLTHLDQTKSVSREHAVVAIEEGVVSVVDAGSSNGTSVNGVPVEPGMPRPLTDGDRVSFGEVELLFKAQTLWPESEATLASGVRPMATTTLMTQAGATVVMHAQSVGAQTAWTACTSHAHLRAIGLCPGCLQPFCTECLPERGDEPLICRSCLAISERLGRPTVRANSSAEPERPTRRFLFF